MSLSLFLYWSILEVLDNNCNYVNVLTLRVYKNLIFQAPLLKFIHELRDFGGVVETAQRKAMIFYQQRALFQIHLDSSLPS
jgi:hypothetical protein